MERLEAFRAAWDAYVPDASDPPDNVPFYRTWRGLQAAWGEDFVRENHHPVHQCACWGSGEAKRGGPEAVYRVACSTLRDLGQRAEMPREPYWELGYSLQPSEPTEADAVRLFREQYRAKFNGQHRLGSKHAKQAWAEKAGQAMEIVQREYRERLTEYQREEAEREDRNGKKRGEWEAEKARVRAFQAAVAERVGNA